MSWGQVRDRLKIAFGSGEDAHRLAISWAVGVGVGLSPLLGLHTVLALGLALLFRLNKVDVLLGTLIISPWTLPLYWLLASRVGSLFTGFWPPLETFQALPHPVEIFQAAFWRQQERWLVPVMLNWLVGASLLAAVTGTGVYLGLRSLIFRHRRPASSPGMESL